MGIVTLGFGFATPKRHFLARNRVDWRILCQNRRMRLGCSFSLEPKNRVTVPRGAKSRMSKNETPWTNLDKILLGGRYPRRNYLHKFWWPSVKGFLGEAQISLSPKFSHRLSSSTLQHYRPSVWTHYNFDNKKANTAVCSLSIMLTATDQKLQKSIKRYITQHHVDILALWCGDVISLCLATR